MPDPLQTLSPLGFKAVLCREDRSLVTFLDEKTEAQRSYVPQTTQPMGKQS